MKCFFNLITSALVVVLASSAGAVSEAEFKGVVWENLVLQIKDNAEIGHFQGVGNKSVGYAVFGGERVGSTIGAIVISPGRGESALKYTEVAYDLMNLGYGPIYITDHRGQGLSERLAKNKQAGHVERFENYVLDLNKFVNEIVLVDKGHKKLFLLAHSTGSTIAGNYLKKYQNIFDAAILTSPLIMALDAKNYTGGENGAMAAAGLMCQVDAQACVGHDCNSSRKLWDYTPASQNDLTHSKTRYDFYYNMYEKFPEMKLGKPTYGWLYESIRGAKALRGNPAEKIKTPMLVFLAEEDSVIDNQTAEELFCNYISGCKTVSFAGSRHEIWFEIDSIRNEALSLANRFFQ